METPKGIRDRQVSELFSTHYDSFRSLAFLLMGDRGYAEEVVMDVFAKALSRWMLFRGLEEPPSYMRRMVINECRSRMRRRSIEHRVNQLFHRHQEDERNRWPQMSPDRLDVWKAVRRLPHRQRACIVLRYQEDLSEAEIADVLDCPLGTVKSQLSRARAKLAEDLGDERYLTALQRPQ